MARKCDICGKGPQFGNNVSHSKVATKRRWLPNIQKVTVTENGRVKHVRACTRCLRSLHKV
jgi:large subunit ribosomal protein L28